MYGKDQEKLAEPRQICLRGKGGAGNLLCMTTLDTEFQQQAIAWDIQATFVLANGRTGNEGILVRVNDNRMVVPTLRVCCGCHPGRRMP
jgi:hypothetical protein